MRLSGLSSVGLIVLAVALLPASVSAQRGSGRHHDGHQGHRSVDRSGVKRSAPVPPTVIKDVVVQQPIVAGWGLQAPDRQIGFGTTPVSTGFGTPSVRTGFGTPPVRTGFETPPVRTGFETQTGLVPVPAEIAGHQGFKSKGIHRHRQGSGVIVVGYPVLVPYPYLPQYGVTTSAAGPYFPPWPTQSTVQGAAVGVSAGPSTYWMDLANETGAASGLTFNVRPAATQVYMDGDYIGTVQDFSVVSQPLLVLPGIHRLELHAPGYRAIALDVNLAAGQVVPYEGSLEPLRP